MIARISYPCGIFSFNTHVNVLPIQLLFFRIISVDARRNVSNIFKSSLCALDRCEFKLRKAGTITRFPTQADRYAIACGKW